MGDPVSTTLVVTTVAGTLMQFQAGQSAASAARKQADAQADAIERQAEIDRKHANRKADDILRNAKNDALLIDRQIELLQQEESVSLFFNKEKQKRFISSSVTAASKSGVTLEGSPEEQIAAIAWNMELERQLISYGTRTKVEDLQTEKDALKFESHLYAERLREFGLDSVSAAELDAMAVRSGGHAKADAYNMQSFSSVLAGATNIASTFRAPSTIRTTQTPSLQVPYSQSINNGSRFSIGGPSLTQRIRNF